MKYIELAKKIIDNENFSIIDESNEGIIISFKDNKLLLTKEDLQNYLELKESIINEPETAIFINGYYEQLLQTLSRPIYSSRFRDDDGNIVLTTGDKEIKTVIGKPSSLFILFFLNNKKILSYRSYHWFRVASRRYDNEKISLIPFRDLFRRFTTIKISTIQENFFSAKREKFLKVAESSLFNIAYGSGTGFMLAKSWEYSPVHIPRLRRESVQFPRKFYNSELVSLYLLAISNDTPMLRYLVFYNIIEYFFTSAAEAVLHKQLKERLTLPEFSYTKDGQLRKLTKIIRRHDQKVNESQQLRIVLETYFLPDEILDWITEYEKDTSYYTIPQEIFGKKFSVDENYNQIFSSLATRIYHIRNVIVHNKESEENRYVPYSGAEEVLSGELPLLQFIAEQLIIKNGVPLKSSL